MRLFRLTFATIIQRKAWVVCFLAVLVLPYALPAISSATEKPILIQPARILAAWSTLWVCSLIWGFFTAARHGEENARSGVGEYFLTTGVSGSRQLLQIWLAVFSFVALMTLITTAICAWGTRPFDPAEHSAWWLLNLQYASLFLLAIAPLLVLAIALASRFGSITGFSISLGLTLYGLWGVGYLDNMLQLGDNPALQNLWLFSPHYRFADLTQRLYFKSGALSNESFCTLLVYFTGILAVYAGVSRLCFRIKTSS